MKFQVTIDDYTALYRAINGAVAEHVSRLPLSVESKALEAACRAYKIGDLCRRKWFEDGESLTVEIDTEAETCRVVPL